MRLAALLLLGFALPVQAQTHLLADVDGDGRADAVRLTNTQVFVQYSTGNGFGPPTYFGDIGHQHCHNESGCAAPSIAVGDVDGDGRADVVAFVNGTPSVLPRAARPEGSARRPSSR